MHGSMTQCLGCVRVGCCFACGCVHELVVGRVRVARVSCPRLRFETTTITQDSGRRSYILQVYLVKKPVNFGPHFLVNESETR